MLTEHKLKTLESLISESTPEELIWINGYLNGLMAEQKGLGNGSNAAGKSSVQGKKGQQESGRITLCYGTETGNSKKLALQFTQALKAAGLVTVCKGLDQYRFEDLAMEKNFLVVVSTQGEGEAPEPAKKFFDQLAAASLDLSAMHFAVLALGDTAYPLFCKAGEDLDMHLQRLGGKRLLPLLKCDVDFEAESAGWLETVLKTLHKKLPEASALKVTQPSREKAHVRKMQEGEIIAHINLNDWGSRKQTYHLEIHSQEEIEYEPGDAIAIVPENRPEVVGRILSLAGVRRDEIFEHPKGKASAAEWLGKKLNVCYLLANTVKKYAALTGHEIPDTRMDLVDLLRIYPLRDAAQFAEVLALLSPIAPRLYSVSSSARNNPRMVHLTVGKHRFLDEGNERFGLCSAFLGDLSKGTRLSFYVHRNRAFKLPSEEKPVIMIGPGTGVAPFRAFLMERDLTGASGRNWFFFGEQHFLTDFLYQSEMQQYLQTGVLHKLSLAFSRDQQEKIYVQDRIRESAAEFYRWIEEGAYIYVSGTKDPMSKDVEKAILDVIAAQGGKSAEEAKAFLDELKKEGRYQKDVY